MLGTHLFKAPLLRLSHLNSKTMPENTFLYSFDYKGRYSRFGYGGDISKYPFDGGVHHSDDNIYLFPWPSAVLKLNADDKKVAQNLVRFSKRAETHSFNYLIKYLQIDLWTSFAITGKPTSTEVTEWPPVSKTTGPYLHIDKKCTVGLNYFDEFDVVSREYKIELEKSKTVEAEDSSFGKINKTPTVDSVS